MINKMSDNGGAEKKKDIIISREEYSSLIEKEFDSLLMGDFGLSIITGEAGIGKTFLVNQYEDLFFSNNSTFIKVKFAQYNQDLFSPIINVVDEILKHILTLDKDSYKVVRSNLKSDLKNDCNIIAMFSPYAQTLFDTNNKETSIEDIKEYKISDAICHILKAASKVLFPLVIFIDDLQWADNISISVIKHICEDRDSVNMHLILTYREQENVFIDEQFKSYEKIKLSAFTAADVRKYVSLFFACNIDNLDNLSQLTFNLTKGNPFHLNVFVNQMLNDNIITKKQGKYTADIGKIANIELSKNIKAVILNQIKSLSRLEIEILKMISCSGGYIDEGLLAMFFYDSKINLDYQLENLCNKGLLVTQYNDDRLVYRFVHDIVYGVMFNMQSERERMRKYYHIASIMKNTGYSKDFPLIAASFLIKTDKSYIREDEVYEWITTLAKAGEAAQSRGNIEHALKIYEFCDELFEISTKKPEQKCYLDFQLSYMKCQFINEKEKEAEKRYCHLLELFFQRDDVIKIKLTYIYCYAYSANWEKVLSLGTDILKYLDFSFSTSSIPLDLLRSRLMYSNRKIRRIKDNPLISDKRILTILEVLVIMFPAANRLDLKSFNLLALKLAILSAKYGNSRYSPIGYASYCYVLFFTFSDYKKGDRLQKITLDLLNNPHFESNRSIAYAVIGTFTYHWTNTFSNTLDCLQKSVDSGEDESEYLYSNYATVFSIITQYVMGRPLDKVEDYINTQKKKKDRLENYLTRHMFQIYLSQIEFLRTGCCSDGYSIDESKQLFYDTIKLNEDMIKLHRFYLEKNFLEAYQLTKQIKPLVEKHKGFVLNGDFRFYSTLTRISIHHILQGKEKIENKKVIENNMKILRGWSNVFPQNHSARYYLAKAEYVFNVMKSRPLREDYYFKAIQESKKENNVQLEALANLLAARHFLYHQKLSEVYATEATDLYEQWGADYIADLIRDEFSIIKSTASTNDIPFEDDAKERVVLEDLSHIGTLSEDDAYQGIMDYLINNHYANYCCVLFESNGEMYLRYSKRRDGETKIHKNHINMNYIDRIPHKLIRYVCRTEKAMVLSENPDRGIFYNDLLFSDKETISMACIPIRQFDVLIGVIYLELCREADENIEDIVKFLVSLLPSRKYTKTCNAKKHNILTARETQIMELINMGMSNSQISEKLFIVEGTVRNHLSKIYDKLGVDNRIQAAIQARENNIIK